MAADRKYFRVVNYTDQDKVRQTKLEPIRNGETIASGEEIEVQVTVEAENDFDYVAFSDPKPAGCEPVDQTSGGTWGGSYMYRELHDEEVTFFADSLRQGQDQHHRPPPRRVARHLPGAAPPRVQHVSPGGAVSFE